MTRVGGVGLDLGAQPTDVYVNEAAVTEVVVAPHFVEQSFAAEHFAGALGKLAEQPELGLGEVDLSAFAQDLAFVGNQFEITEDEASMALCAGPNATEQCSDASRELFGRKWLGEVVVGSSFKTSDDVVGVIASSDHDDRDVAGTAQGATQFEAIDAREHDVDQNNVRCRTIELLDRLFAALGFVDDPPLVLEREFDR